MLGFVTVAIIGVIIGAIFKANTADDIKAAEEEAENSRLHPNEGLLKTVSAQTPVKPIANKRAVLARKRTILASDKHLKVYVPALVLIFGLWAYLIISFASDGLYSEMDAFGVMITLIISVIFITLFAIIAAPVYKTREAIKSKQVILEFTSSGFQCHSKISGPVGQFKWTDVISFHPATAATGVVSAAIITLKGTVDDAAVNQTKRVRYTTQAIDLEIIPFIKYLENYTGLKADSLSQF